MPALILASDGLSDLDPGFLRDWIIALACLGGLVLLSITIAEKLRGAGKKIAPDPLNVRKHPDISTKDEVRELAQRIGTELDDLRKQMAEERRTSREAFGKVHRRIDLVAENTNEIKGRLAEIAATTQKLLERAMEL